MRANQLFVLALVSISCVVSTSFQAQLKNAEFKAQVETLKAQNNMGSVIMSMAELATEGRFTALYKAIDDLSAFLVKDRAQENQSFQEATEQFHKDVARLTGIRDKAKRLYEADQANLDNKLYPERKRLIALIASLENTLERLESDLKELRENRRKEIAVYQANSADYAAGVASCKKALPILQELVNGQSFAEIDADLFAEVSNNLKSSLSRLPMGQLYGVFVESMVESLKMKNFVDQAGLAKVIGLIQDLQSRLESGIVALDADEVANKAAFEKAQAALEHSIADTKQQLVDNRAALVTLKALIARVEKHRDEQIAIYKKAVKDLALVNKMYKQRTADHVQFLAEVNDEEMTIAQAITILNAAGVTRTA